MQVHAKKSFLILSGLFLLAGGPLVAGSVVQGVAVGSSGSSTPVGSTVVVDSMTFIDFFIPLGPGASGTYGVDCCTSPDGGLGNGSVDMWLYFAGNDTGGGGSVVVSVTLDFWFIDLDLSGVNDPDGFLEEFELISAGGETFNVSVTSSGDSAVDSADKDAQHLSFTLDPSFLTEDFWVKVQMRTPEFLLWHKNTSEQMKAVLTVVTRDVSTPEPTALLLLGTALTGLGLLRRRR